MASKLEYLQRYMSSSGGDAESDKKRKKKVKKTKKTKSAAQGTRVVDADDAWEQSAPSREDIEKKWEQDATEDEQPLVVAADGEQLEDPQDLPVYVDSDKYLDEFRGKKKQKEDGDLSPPRKKKTGGPRGRDNTPDQKPTNEPSKRDDKNLKKESVKADGKEEKKAGLFTATEFEAQRKVAARRKDVLHGVDASEMGANAETVYRDKRGRKLDMLNEMVRQQEVLDGKRKREEREEYEWGTGEVQKRERMSKQELIEQMKKTPFARHEDDEELERKRRDRVRAFDPINSKTFREDPLAEEGKGKKQKSKKDRKKTSQAKPKYAGPPAPPNRFGIMPGYRWDGVVRGTNWEEKIMMRQNANTAVSEEAYKYAVADM
uniref:Pre-mRNA-splicing factor CWC26 n=1 Tax=Phytophthora ramorum TaxID=164328 RepID=H3GLI2_PHYRM